MVAGNSRPEKNSILPNGSYGHHMENWNFVGSGTTLEPGYL